MPPPLPQATCVHCRKSIGIDDAYCRHCGRRQGTGSAWYYSTGGILLLAFFVIGPFALILVWQSTRMGGTAKKTVAALIVVYTVLTAYYFYRLMVLILAEMSQLGDVLNGV